MDERHRIDLWLKNVCLFKHRSQATDALRGGLVKVNGQRVQQRVLRPGDEIAIAKRRYTIDYELTAGKHAMEELMEDDIMSQSLLEKAGLVSGAVFSDLDNDGKPDLVLACEWGPIRVFHNDGGHFTEVTGQLGLDRSQRRRWRFVFDRGRCAE